MDQKGSLSVLWRINPHGVCDEMVNHILTFIYYLHNQPCARCHLYVSVFSGKTKILTYYDFGLLWIKGECKQSVRHKQYFLASLHLIKLTW